MTGEEPLPTHSSLPDLIRQSMRPVSMDHRAFARRSITSDLCRAQGFGPRRRVKPGGDEKDALPRMALGDAIHLLLHRQASASM
jgi:hypothetical protein